jgi:phage terminase small subunit
MSCCAAKRFSVGRAKQARDEQGRPHLRKAEVQASQLLRNLKVQAAVQAAVAARSQRTEVTADNVVRELAKLGFANMLDYLRSNPGGDLYLDFSALTRDQAAALQEATVEDYVEGRGENAREVKRVRFRLADKRAALVDLGRHLQIFQDKLEIAGKLEVQISDVREPIRSKLARLAANSGAGRGSGGPE